MSNQTETESASGCSLQRIVELSRCAADELV
jgi:hypothetical protein